VSAYEEPGFLREGEKVAGGNAQARRSNRLQPHGCCDCPLIHTWHCRPATLSRPLSQTAIATRLHKPLPQPHGHCPSHTVPATQSQPHCRHSHTVATAILSPQPHCPSHTVTVPATQPLSQPHCPSHTATQSPQPHSRHSPTDLPRAHRVDARSDRHGARDARHRDRVRGRRERHTVPATQSQPGDVRGLPGCQMLR
jgi:hypothetical protein